MGTVNNASNTKDGENGNYCRCRCNVTVVYIFSADGAQNNELHSIFCAVLTKQLVKDEYPLRCSFILATYCSEL